MKDTFIDQIEVMLEECEHRGFRPKITAIVEMTTNRTRLGTRRRFRLKNNFQIKAYAVDRDVVFRGAQTAQAERIRLEVHQLEKRLRNGISIGQGIKLKRFDH